jgi:hypothetical protein
MKKIVVAAILLLLFSSSQVFALSIVAIEAHNKNAIDAWIAGQGSKVQILEDFEDKTTGWYKSLSTEFGTFTAAGSHGMGSTSYKHNVDKNSTEAFFAIRDASWAGRGNVTPSGKMYLDSGDITKLSLSLTVVVPNLFFYIQDPSDQNAITTISALSGDNGAIFNFTNQRNATLWFIGIAALDGQMIESIVWQTSHQKDGFGLDQFSTVTPIPEPGTLLLLGFGIFGLAIVGRKRLAIEDGSSVF